MPQKINDWVEVPIKRDAINDWQEVPLTEPKVSPSESYLRGAIQGIPAIGPWTDEAEAGVRSIFGKDYKTERDIARGKYSKAEKDNPAAYLSGVMTPTLATAPIKSIPVLGTGLSAILGAVEGAGASEGDNVGDILKDAALSGGLSAATMGIGNKLAPIINKGTKKIGSGARYVAEKLAVNSTGATAKQTEKFAENAGAELLDRGFIKAGASPEGLSKRLEIEMKKSGSAINAVLEELDKKGVAASADNVIAGLEKEIVKLSKDSSKASEVRKLQTFIDDIINTGESKIPISLGEETKKGFRKQSGNWLDPEAGAAAKKVYLGYRDEVERAANEAAPDLAKLFKQEKETYGLLAPIQEAAERRAAQLNQHPWGGLLDIATIGTGAATGGEEGVGTGLALAALRRGGAKRISSTSAVVLNNLSKVIKRNPEAMGKFAPLLIQAQQKGGNALKEANSALSLIFPEYVDHLEEIKKNSKK